eukprot:SAG31_NODE_7809_length_1592_cov_0.941728_1_plen_39_part_10
MSRTQIWDTDSPMISNRSGVPVLHFGTTHQVGAIDLETV